MVNNSFLTISDLNKLVKSTLEDCFYLKNIIVRGELQSFKKNAKTGHYFFKLVDKDASITSVIYSWLDYQNYETKFKDGDLVEVVGSITYYNKRGEISFSISSMKLCGDGEKLLKKKQLLEKLNNLGYFDEKHKQSIPKFPTKIGIITSSSGAAIADITKNIFARTKMVEIVLFPCIVQGSEAKQSILEALKKASNQELDTIIIGRGGGSKDDLAAFDEEEIAIAVYNLKTPVISAVGHEIDKSVVDYIADKSVSTPTEAAILAVPNDEDLLEYIAQKSNELNLHLKHKINNFKNQIENYANFSFFKDYSSYFENLKITLNNYENTLNNYWKTTRNLLVQEISKKELLLENLNPQNLLNNGYAIISDLNGNVIDSIKTLEDEKEIYIQLKDGKILFKGGK